MIAVLTIPIMFNSVMNDQKMTTPIHDTQIKTA